LPPEDREILVEAARRAGLRIVPRVEIISETLHVKWLPLAEETSKTPKSFRPRRMP
jgi:hypothetical protein